MYKLLFAACTLILLVTACSASVPATSPEVTTEGSTASLAIGDHLKLQAWILGTQIQIIAKVPIVTTQKQYLETYTLTTKEKGLSIEETFFGSETWSVELEKDIKTEVVLGKIWATLNDDSVLIEWGPFMEVK